MRVYVAISVILVAFEYVSTGCVKEGNDGAYKIVKCTSVLVENLSENIEKTVGLRDMQLTLENVDFNNLNSLSEDMYYYVDHLIVISNSREIAGDAFSKFKYFRSLTVHESHISTTKFKIMFGEWLGNSTEPFGLDLANNSISSVSSTCDDNPRLDTIILKQNNISSLQDNSFGQCPLLRTLDLSYNKVINISMNPFHGLSNLTNLNLSNNLIEYISRSTFTNLSSLQNLGISHNKIKHLEAGSFNGLYNLDNLNLESNEISILVPHTFNETKNLTILKLQGNIIKELQPQALTGLHNLIRLNLKNNQLSMLTPDTFNETLKLTTLELDNNIIKYILSGAFNGLNNLEYLSLAYNQLSAFPPTSSDETLTNFSCKMSDTPLYKLQKLDLGHNKISAIKSCAFELFPNLTELLLNNNVLSHLQLEVLSSLSKLKVLNLTYNWLTQIDGAIQHPLASLTQLDISYNQLVDFNVKNIMSYLTQLKYMGIGGNYWNCRQLQEVLLYLSEKGVDTKPHYPVLHYDDNVNGIRCAGINNPKSKIDALFSNFTARFKEINSFLKENNRTYDNKLNELFNFGNEINRSLTALTKETNFILEENNRTYNNKLDILSTFVTAKFKEINYNNSDIAKLLYIIIFLFIIVVCVLLSAFVIMKVYRKIRRKNRPERQWSDQTENELINLTSS